MDDQNKNNPLVSVCIPAYNNRANYLPEIIDSWLAQTCKDFELIISDDASTDDTQKICEEYAKRDPRIRYYRQQKNLNIPANQRFLFNHARGKYFNWAADDDVYGPRFLEDCLAVFEKDSKLVMVFADMVDIDKNGKQFQHPDPAKYMPLARDTYERLKEFILFYHEDRKAWLYCGLWKKEDVLGYPLFGHNDWNDHPPYYWGFEYYFIFRNLARGPFGFVPQVRFFRRSRVLDDARPPRSLIPRIWHTFRNRLSHVYPIMHYDRSIVATKVKPQDVFGSPYFWYNFRLIWGIKEMPYWQRVKLVFWNFFAMMRVLTVRKI